MDSFDDLDLIFVLAWAAERSYSKVCICTANHLSEEVNSLCGCYTNILQIALFVWLLRTYCKITHKVLFTNLTVVREIVCTFPVSLTSSHFQGHVIVLRKQKYFHFLNVNQSAVCFFVVVHVVVFFLFSSVLNIIALLSSFDSL